MTFRRNLQGNSVEHRYYREVRTETDSNGRKWLIAPADTHRVRSKKQDEAFKRRQRGRQHEFVWNKSDAIKLLSQKLSNKHLGYLFMLACYLDYEGRLVTTKNTFMKRGDVMEALRVGKSTYAEFMGAMKDNGVIYEEEYKKEQCFHVNELYHQRGRLIGTVHTSKTLIAEMKKVYPHVSAADLGMLYKLLPYLSRINNTLCHNPDEKDPKYIDPLNKSELVKITGLSEKTLYSQLRRMKFGNQKLFAIMISGRSEWFMVNPFVVNRMDGYPDKTQRMVFNLNK